MQVERAPELLIVVGGHSVPPPAWPGGAVAFSFHFATAIVSFHRNGEKSSNVGDRELTILISAETCRRTFGLLPTDPTIWRLPGHLRAIALQVRDCRVSNPAKQALRTAKSIELMCSVFDAIGDGSLVPVDGASELSEADARRIAAARTLIDERWREKLTLETIARTCGLNRAKLTRGFRSMFACSVADAIAERRMSGARELLLATDLPVSQIGHRCGYLNNASFARAFSRRFGLAPTRLRADKLAA